MPAQSVLMAQKDTSEFFKIKVRPEAKGVIAEWKRRSKVPELALASSVYEWFGRQPEVVQRAILGLSADHEDEIDRIVLAGLSEKAKDQPKRKPVRGGGIASAEI